MKSLTGKQEQAIKWHLQGNVFPPLNEVAMNGVIGNINSVRTGEKTLSDEIVSGSGVSIGEMVDDLRLSQYLSSQSNS